MRNDLVTGVQTCALPIYPRPPPLVAAVLVLSARRTAAAVEDATLLRVFLSDGTSLVSFGEPARVGDRSEERRGGKECRSRWAPYHSKKETVLEEICASSS